MFFIGSLESAMEEVIKNIDNPEQVCGSLQSTSTS